jgi:hypothetical protein
VSLTVVNFLKDVTNVKGGYETGSWNVSGIYISRSLNKVARKLANNLCKVAGNLLSS